MKIILDGFGGDNAPLEVIKAGVRSKKELGVEIVITGDENKIKAVSKENGLDLTDIKIVNATQVISMEDNATDVVKAKSDSSMAVGLKLLHDGEGDAFISAGNSGALNVGGTMLVKRIKGIKRPGFATVVPTSNGCVMLMDVGANIDCKPEMLFQFAVMGSIYMEKVMGIKNPRVGLANVGTEEHKGGELQHKTYELLKKSELNFVGNVEGRDIPDDGCDVLVTDGFNGNLILKTYEGVALVLMNKIKGIFKTNTKTKLAAALIMNQLNDFKKSFDYNEYGGAPILGTLKPVFKAHGSSKETAIVSTVKQAIKFVESNVIGEISSSI